MKKSDIVFLGLVASCLSIFANLVLLLDIQTHEIRTHWVIWVNTASPFYDICLLIALRFLTVRIFHLRYFRIPIDFIMVFKFFGFIISLLVNLKVIDSQIAVIALSVNGLLITILYFVFLIMIFRTGKEKVTGMLLLRIYAIALIANILLSFALPFIIRQGDLFRLIVLKAINTIPYIFAILFLLRNYKDLEGELTGS
jgi:hypothetical protein